MGLIYLVLRCSGLSCSFSSARRQVRRFVLCICMLYMMVFSANAQWQLVTDEESIPWIPRTSVDSTLTLEQQVVRMFHQDGYLYAVIDSLDVQAQTLFVSRGPRAEVGAVRLLGARVIDSSLVSVPLKKGDWVTSNSLKQAAEMILEHYSRTGYVLAEVAIEAIIPRDSLQHDVIIRVQEGIPTRLERLILQGAKRTRPAYVYHTSGLASGQILKNFNPEDMQGKLEATGMFSRVDLPVLYKATDSSVVVHVSVKENSPGAFDLALGYERAEGGGGALVGSGRLALRNLFGGARTLELALNRAPGQLGYVMVRVEAPLMFGLPLSLAGSFEGLQQDSTYGKREYGARFGYWIDPSMQIFASVTREVTRPGLAGTELINGRQRIPIADALFFGGGIRIRQVDHALSPRRGYLLNMHAERGHKDEDRVTVVADSTRQQRRLTQGRLTAQGRIYIPLSRRTLLATGGELMLMRSREFDESDLFRVGGAQSLRGYDEHRFRASFAVRTLMEFRYLLDRVTYGFSFFDLGYLGNRKGSRFPTGWYPGFGAGFQLDTAAGIINFTLATTTEDISAVRAHISLSLGI